MRIIVLTLLLYFQTIPVSMYYLYDEHPSMGYFAFSNVGEHSKPKVSVHKTYFHGNSNQKFTKLVNERVVDSHFAVLKSSPKSLITVSDNEITNDLNTVQNKEETEREKKNHEFKDEIKTEEKDNNQLALEKILVSETKELDKSKQDIYKYHNEHLGNAAYDPHTVALIKYISSEPQNVPNKKKNKQTSYKQAKIRGSGVKDKVLHKTNLNIERNAKIMSRSIDDLSIKLIDRSYKQRDNKKRDIDKFTTEAPKEDIRSISESMKKYFPKDISAVTNKRDSNAKQEVAARIGSYATQTEKMLMPYAVFYKMSQENFEPQDYTVEKGDHIPVETQGNSFYNDKEKLMVTIENELNEENSKLSSDMKHVFDNYYGTFLHH